MVTIMQPGRICSDFAADGVFVLELEVLAHLTVGKRMAAVVLPLGDGEDDEEGQR